MQVFFILIGDNKCCNKVLILSLEGDVSRTNDIEEPRSYVADQSSRIVLWAVQMSRQKSTTNSVQAHSQRYQEGQL